MFLFADVYVVMCKTVSSFYIIAKVANFGNYFRLRTMRFSICGVRGKKLKD